MTPFSRRSSDAHKLFASPIFFATKSSQAKAPPEKRVKLPPNTDIYIEVLAERIDPHEPPQVEIADGGLQQFQPVDFAPAETKLIKVVVPRGMFTAKRFKVTCRLIGTSNTSTPLFLGQFDR
jgi:hypothetical protein